MNCPSRYTIGLTDTDAVDSADATTDMTVKEV